jgi:tripartite-type tricarboxylate transporter receptor subunit TctC
MIPTRFLAALLLAPSLALAQAYPTHAVTIVVPFPPGGGTDTGTRLIANKLSQKWGQTVVVENKGGAAGMLGADVVSKARPDGYTLLMGNVGTQSINPILYGKRLPYNPDGAFAPLVLVAELPLVMVAGPSMPEKTPAAVLARVRANPGKVTYASSGPGGAPHLAGALFESQSKTEMLHVPYKGGGPALADTLAGHTDVYFGTILESLGLVKEGRLHAIAVTSDKRHPSLPDVPTLDESGLPGFNTGSWIGLLAPAGTPQAIVDRIARDVSEVVRLPDIRSALTAQGAIPAGGTPEAFATLIESDRKRYGDLIRARNITAD